MKKRHLVSLVTIIKDCLHAHSRANWDDKNVVETEVLPHVHFTRHFLGFQIASTKCTAPCFVLTGHRFYKLLMGKLIHW